MLVSLNVVTIDIQWLRVVSKRRNIEQENKDEVAELTVEGCSLFGVS